MYRHLHVKDDKWGEGVGGVSHILGKLLVLAGGTNKEDVLLTLLHEVAAGGTPDGGADLDLVARLEVQVGVVVVHLDDFHLHANFSSPSLSYSNHQSTLSHWQQTVQVSVLIVAVARTHERLQGGVNIL